MIRGLQLRSQADQKQNAAIRVHPAAPGEVNTS